MTDIENEINLIRSVFKGNESLMKTMRKLFFGLDIAEDEKALLRNTFSNQPLLQAVRKKFYPLLTDDTPIAFSGDYWLAAEKDIQGQHPDTITQVISSKEKVLTMLQYAMSLLENPDQPKVELDFNPRLIVNDPLQIWFLARCLYIRTIQQAFGQIAIVANTTDKTPEQIREQKFKDSTK